jgi:hypothetical protein
MNTTDTNEARILQYLLGELAEEEQGHLEEQFFADDALYQEVRVAERELIDRYVLGQLTGRERARFESRFLSSSQRREKVALARSFRQGIAAVTAPGKPKVAAARPTLHDRLVRWLSPLWAPLLAGEVATAADTAAQAHTFYRDEGEIRVTCEWRAAVADQPAILRIAWQVSLRRPGNLWVQVTRRDDPAVRLAELALGSALEGERVWSADALGFDPSRVPWAMRLVVTEPEA